VNKNIYLLSYPFGVKLQFESESIFFHDISVEYNRLQTRHGTTSWCGVLKENERNKTFVNLLIAEE